MAFLTFNKQYTMVGDITGDDTAARIVGYKRDINIATGILRHQLARYVFEVERTITSVAATQSYQLPARLIRVSHVTYTSGSTPYVVQELTDRAEWLHLNATTGNSSTYPDYFWVDKDKLYFYPKNSTASNTITVRGEEAVKDMTAADYTTGTITTLTNGDDDVTGSGSTWTTAFPGRWFSIDADGVWYEILSRSADTAIKLVKNYEGTSIAAGTSTYSIGEQTLGRYEDLHLLPVYYALANYYALREDSKKHVEYLSLWKSGLAEAKETYGSRTSTNVIASRRSMPRHSRSIGTIT